MSPYVHRQRSDLSYKQKNQLLLNDGAGKFTDTPTALPDSDVRVHRGACFGDVNGDGRVDVLTTANNDRPTLLRNESTPARWLMLRLKDARGGVTPIGARCTATVDGRKLTRVFLGGGSYGGDSDPRVHFGLGSAARVERMEIRWPSGKVQELTDLAADQVHDVTEPR